MDNLSIFDAVEDEVFYSLELLESIPAEDDDIDDDYEEDDEEEEASEEYGQKMDISVLYKGHEEETQNEYIGLGLNAQPDEDELDAEITSYLRENGVRTDADGTAAPMVEYEPGMRLGAGEADLLSQATYNADVLTIEYGDVELINDQRTYQRIVFEADRDGESVYELSMRKFGNAGMEAAAEYDDDFESMIFTSINHKEEGAQGNFNEFYLNGEIGRDSADGQKLKKGDLIEWRYAEETDGSCGGCPDFSTVKKLLEYTASLTAGYANMGLTLPGQMRQPYASPLAA